MVDTGLSLGHGLVEPWGPCPSAHTGTEKLGLGWGLELTGCWGSLGWGWVRARWPRREALSLLPGVCLICLPTVGLG